LADQLAKAAARDSDAETVLNRFPICIMVNEIKEKTALQWQEEWKGCTKVQITKEFFTTVQDRQRLKIRVNPIVAAIVTGHGKTRPYLHLFKILEEATFPCGNEDQTIEHLINRCPILHTQRELLKSEVTKYGNWPANIHELMSKRLKSFLLFLKSTNFDVF
jgi:hypothetical protein